MRQFIVLGYTSNSTRDPGECLYLGTDRGEAMATVNAPGEHARRELYDLAAPQIRRHSAVEPVAPVDQETGDEDTDPETGDEDIDPEEDPDKNDAGGAGAA